MGRGIEYGCGSALFLRETSPLSTNSRYCTVAAAQQKEFEIEPWGGEPTSLLKAGAR